MRQIINISVYTILVVIGIHGAKGDPRLPAKIGGAGTAWSPGLYWPYLSDDPSTPIYTFWPRGARLFQILTHGYHIFVSVEQLICNRDKKNFNEMMLHHVNTIFSTNYCYFANLQGLSFGATMITSISDIFMNFGKILRDFNFHPILVTASYLSILISWVVTRNYYFAYACYASTYKFRPGQKWPYDSQYDGLWYKTRWGFRFTMMNIILLNILNYFWLFRILQIGYNKLFKGEGGFFDQKNKIDDGIDDG